MGEKTMFPAVITRSYRSWTSWRESGSESLQVGLDAAWDTSNWIQNSHDSMYDKFRLPKALTAELFLFVTTPFSPSPLW